MELGTLHPRSACYMEYNFSADMTQIPHHFQHNLADEHREMLWHDSQIPFSPVDRDSSFQAIQNFANNQQASMITNSQNLANNQEASIGSTLQANPLLHPGAAKYHQELAPKMRKITKKTHQKSSFAHHYFKRCNEGHCVDFSSTTVGNITAQIENSWNDQIPSPTCVLSDSPSFRSYTSGYSTPDDQQQFPHTPSLESILGMQGSTGSSISSSMQVNDSDCRSLNELMNFMVEESNKPNHVNRANDAAMPTDPEQEGTTSWLSPFEGTMIIDGSLHQDNSIYHLLAEKSSNISITDHTIDTEYLTESINAFTDGSLDHVEGTRKQANIYAQESYKDSVLCHQDYNRNLDGETQEWHNLASYHPSVLASQDMQELKQITMSSIVPKDTSAAIQNNDDLHMMIQFSTSAGDDHIGVRLIHLLMAGAEAIATRDMDLAAVILVRLRELVSPIGNTMQRIAAHFSEGLHYRIEGGCLLQIPSLFYNTLYDKSLSMSLSCTSSSWSSAVNSYIEANNTTNRYTDAHPTQQHQATSSTIRSNSSSNVLAAFQILHEILPYIKFGHFTANQAILEAVQDEKRIHIVDYEIMEGIQWPCLMQALAHRKGDPPQHLRITALWRSTGSMSSAASKRTSCNSSPTDMSSVQATGKRLADFAASLNLPFTFNHLRVDSEDHEVHASALKLVKGEALVVNCMLQLPHMPYRRGTSAMSFLKSMHKLHPLIVTVGEDELGCNNTSSICSFVLEALHHYSSVFDSLEACLTTETAKAGMLVERMFLAPRIASAVAFCGGSSSLSDSTDPQISSPSSRRKWHSFVSAAGFTSRPLSFHNFSQARLLVGLFKDGFKLQEYGNRLVLGWQCQPLMAASAWTM